MNIGRKQQIERFCTGPLAKQEYKDLWFDYLSEEIGDQELEFRFNALQSKRFTSGFGRDDKNNKEREKRN